MNQSFLISGAGLAPDPSLQPRATRGSRTLRLLVVVWLLAALGFILVKWQLRTAQPQAPASNAAPVGPTAISVEDLLHHMDAMNLKLTAAVGKIRRAQDQMGQVLPSMERNYLPVEKSRLEHAVAATEAARRDVEQGREEFDLILNSLRKEHELQ